MNFIDGDIFGTQMFVITTTQCYRSSDLTLGSWVLVFDVDGFSELIGLTLSRIRCGTSMIYMLACTGGMGSKTYLIRSSDGGNSWTYFEVVEIDIGNQFTLIEPAGWANIDTYINQAGSSLIFSWGSGGQLAWPISRICAVIQLPFDIWPAVVPPVHVHYQILGDVLSNDYDADGDNVYDFRPRHESWLNVVITPIPGGWDVEGDATDRYAPANRFYFGYAFGGEGRWAPYTQFSRGCAVKIISIAGYEFAAPPTAFDIGRHNENVVYVGTADVIVHSRDAGETWEEYLDQGANDIECHQAQDVTDANITAILTSGDVVRLANGSIIETLYTESLPIARPLRLASHPVTGNPIFALLSDSIMNLQKYDGGWSTLESSIYSGYCIRCKVGIVDAVNLYYLRGGNIRFSGDGGSTFSDKKGNWSGYGNPRTIHPINEPS